MPTINYGTRELTAKIVYYGPGLCGKTTNLQHIHDTLPPEKRSKMLSLATESDRTLFFDFLPIDIGEVRGLKVRLQLYTVPGQVFYNETRKIVLKGADGIVFVADSQKEMLDANLESLKNLKENLQINSLDFKELPHVIQYNKRDLKSAMAIAELDKSLNLLEAPTVEAAAKSGQGVHETLKAISRQVLSTLIEKYGTDREKRQMREKQKTAPVHTKIKLGGGAPAPAGDGGGTVAMMSPFAQAKAAPAEPAEAAAGGTIAMMSPFAEARPVAPAVAAEAAAGGTVAMMSPFATAKKTTAPVPAAPLPSGEAGGTIAMMSPFAATKGSVDAPNLLDTAGEFGGADSGPSLDSLVEGDPTLDRPKLETHVEEIDLAAEVASHAPTHAPAKKATGGHANAFEQIAASAAPKKLRASGPMAKVEIPAVALTSDHPQTLEVPVIVNGRKGKLHILLTLEIDE